MKQSCRLLVYTQDPGGTKYLLPLLLSLEEKVHPHILHINHTQSLDLIPESIRKQNIDILDQYPLSVQHWKQILIDHKIDAVLCTLSSTKLDLTNANLIVAAKSRQLPTIGFLDHWKGFDRFFNQDGEPEYAPDYLGVIDDFCMENVHQYKIPAGKVGVVGHPWLERITLDSRRPDSIDMDKIRILVISQPDASTSNFDSIFCKKINGQTLIEGIASAVTSRFPKYSISFRPHPKENTSCLLPDIVSKDHSSTDELFSRYDLFIGIDSMLLFEAHLARRTCIILQLPEFDDLSDRKTPYEYATVVKDTDNLAQQIGIVLTEGEVKPAFEARGSLAKCEAFLGNFLETMKVINA